MWEIESGVPPLKNALTFEDESYCRYCYYLYYARAHQQAKQSMVSTILIVLNKFLLKEMACFSIYYFFKSHIILESKTSSEIAIQYMRLNVLCYTEDRGSLTVQWLSLGCNIKAASLALVLFSPNLAIAMLHRWFVS